MKTRTKLAAIAGLEGMTRDETVESLQSTIITNVFGGGQDTELEPPEEISEIQVNQALAEATSDVEESSKLVEAYIEQEEEHAEAVADLEQAVTGIESLFEGEFSQVAYQSLMSHAARCAKRAGVELPVKLDGMESMSSATVYLETRNGLEGFMDSVKDTGKKLKELVITVYNYLMDMIKGWIGQFKNLSDKTKLAIVKADKCEDVKAEIRLGRWNRWLDAANTPVFEIIKLFKPLGVALNTSTVSLNDVVTDEGSSLASVKAMVKSISDLPMKKVSGDSSKLTEGYQFDIGNMSVTYTVPHPDNSTSDAFKVFAVNLKQNAEAKEATTKAVYRDLQAVKTELHSVLKFVDGTKDNFEKIHNALRNERDKLVALVNATDGGKNKTKVMNAISAKRKIITDTERLIFNLAEAKCDLLKAHL